MRSLWRSLTTYCPVAGLVPDAPSNQEFSGGFSANLMLKDMLLAQSASNDNSFDTTLGSSALSMYQQMVDKGDRDKDFSAIINHLK